MGKRDKKSSKGRLDKYYHLAKEQGYRARSAFKLIQLNKKYEFLEKSRVLIDLCAAPGGWLQVATKYMPTSSLIIGVDLAPIKPIPNVITFQDDITSDKCRQHLRQEMKTWKADVVLHDGAPNVGTAWAQDAFSQSELVLSSLKLATEFLRKGGIFVTKVFRSKDYNKLMWIFQQLFGKVEATKPASSRNVSAEIFVVCRDYIAPKKIDPRLLDAKTVFEEVDNDGPQTVNDIFKSSKKKTRQRQGYEDGNYTLFKKLDVWEFIKSDSPVVLLGTYNMFDFESDESKELLKKDITTEDIKVNCADLKVLGKRDFKMLLKWRLAVRKEYKMDEEEEKQDEIVVEEEEPMDEDEKLRMELENLTKEEARKLKKQKRKAMAMKMKAIHRAEMHMITPTDIGMEQAHTSMDSLFNIKQIKKNDALEKLQEGDMSVVDDVMDELDSDVDMDAEVARQTKGQIPQYVQALDDSDYDEDLEAQLDEEYERYKERRAEKDPKFKAKLNRAQNDEWHEFDGKNKMMEDDSDSEDDSEQNNDEDEGQNATSSDGESDLEISRLAAADDDEEDDEDDVVQSKSSKGAKSNGNALIRDLGIKSSLAKKTSSGLTLGASMFFDQDIFKGVDGLDEIEDQEDDDKSDAESSAINDQVKSIIGSRKRKAEEDLEEEQQEEDEELEDDDDFEIVGNENIAPSDEEMWDGAEDENSKAVKRARETGLNTVEAIHLARQLANKEKTKNDLIDDGFTKEAFRDKEGLPAWFLDDENKHNRPHLPVTKEAVRAFREKMKLINAQPIKKIREAKARKKHKAVKRLERAQKKAEAIVENEDLTEKEKAQNINRLIARATKSKPKKEVKLVVAKGANRGIKGRPKGVKGRYKMVDRRMKKDLRAQKRREKKKGRK